MLQSPKVCDFYQKLHDKYFEQPKFNSLECRGTSLTLKGNKEGKSLEVNLGFRDSLSVAAKSEGLLKKVFVREAGTVQGEFNVLGDGKVSNLPKEKAPLEQLMNLKFYVQQAIDCCASKDDSSHQTCLNSYNHPGASKPKDSESPSGNAVPSTK